MESQYKERRRNETGTISQARLITQIAHNANTPIAGQQTSKIINTNQTRHTATLTTILPHRRQTPPTIIYTKPQRKKSSPRSMQTMHAHRRFSSFHFHTFTDSPTPALHGGTSRSTSAPHMASALQHICSPHAEAHSLQDGCITSSTAPNVHHGPG